MVAKMKVLSSGCLCRLMDYSPPALTFSCGFMQEYWSGQRRYIKWMFPTQRSNPGLPNRPALHEGFLSSGSIPYTSSGLKLRWWRYHLLGAVHSGWEIWRKGTQQTNTLLLPGESPDRGPWQLHNPWVEDYYWVITCRSRLYIVVTISTSP